MLNRADKIYKNLDDQLKLIELEQPIILRRAELSIVACEQALEQLKLLFSTKKMKSLEEEITFFKKIKPRFSEQLIYNVRVLTIEKEKPHGNKLAQLQFLEKEQKAIDQYFEKNRDFYTYYHSGSTSLDDRYFVRNKLDAHMTIDEYYFHMDRSFTTFHDVKIARILAYKRISEMIKEERQQLETNQSNDNVFHSPITWTDNKVALIELLYALNTAGTFNRGTVELKELAKALSKSFNIDLGDFYRTWSEIKIRKEPTKFLDSLKITLENRIKADME